MNKIIFIKNINSIFIAIILIAGILSQSSLSFLTTASAQAESYVKDVSDNSLNCNNLNVNVNGLELDVLPLSLSTLLTGGETDASAYSYVGSNGIYDSKSSDSETDFRFICINNNNSTVIGEEGEETSEPPESSSTTLTVTKLVTCEDTRLTLVNGPTCVDLLATITENQFNITVGNSFGNVTEFVGSETGTTVTLNPSNYTVTETPDDSVVQEIATLGGNIAGPIPSFTGDCSQAIPGPFEANVPIAAGESQTCNIENHFVIQDGSEGLTAADSPIIAQGTQDSLGLTAVEKIAKLKQQWLDLLP